MPAPNLIACAIMVCISTHTYMLAIYLTNFPIVMLVKSCNIVSVVVVGVFCSRVRDKSLALGPKKIVVAALISIGIVLYNFGGDAKHQEKATDPLGIVLLTISLIADGFLPDFQAVIKAEYKPRPLEMFEHINKWVTIISLTYAIFSGQLSFAYSFVNNYPELGYDMVKLSCLTTIGQVFVYRMIKQFKQHIVPFVITTRKIFTVVISIVFFHHQTTVWQILAIVLILCTASTEYISEIYSSKKTEYHVQLPTESNSTDMMEEEIK